MARRLRRPAAVFAGEVARRLVAPAGLDVARLRLLAVAPPYRVDHLLELGAELHDALAGYRSGRVSPTSVRAAALAVAVEAGWLFLVETTDGERETPFEVADWGEWEEIQP